MVAFPKPNWTASLRSSIAANEEKQKAVAAASLHQQSANRAAVAPTVTSSVRLYPKIDTAVSASSVVSSSPPKEEVPTPPSLPSSDRRAFACQQLCAAPMTHYADNHYLSDLLQWCAERNVFIHPALEIRHERSAYRDFAFRLKFPVPRHTPLIAVPEELVIGFKEDVDSFDRNALFDAQKETNFFKANHQSEMRVVKGSNGEVQLPPILSNAGAGGEDASPSSDADICDFFFYCLGTIVADLVTAQSSQLTDGRHAFAKNLTRIRTLQNAPYLPDNIVFASQKKEKDEGKAAGGKEQSSSPTRSDNSSAKKDETTRLSKAALGTPLKQSDASKNVNGGQTTSTPTAASVASFSSLPPLIHTPSARRQHEQQTIKREATEISGSGEAEADANSALKLGSQQEGVRSLGDGSSSSSANHSDREGDDPDAPIKLPASAVAATEEEECCLADILLQMIRNYLNGGPLVGKVAREDLMAAVSMCLSHSTPLIVGPRRSIGIVPLVHLFPHGGLKTNAVVVARPEDNLGRYRELIKAKRRSLAMATAGKATGCHQTPKTAKGNGVGSGSKQQQEVGQLFDESSNICAALEMAQYFTDLCGYDFVSSIDPHAKGSMGVQTTRSGGATAASTTLRKTKGFVYVVALRDLPTNEAVNVQAMAPVCGKEEESSHMWQLSCGLAPKEYLPTSVVADASRITLEEILGGPRREITF